jgi:hypothetical protein
MQGQTISVRAVCAFDLACTGYWFVVFVVYRLTGNKLEANIPLCQCVPIGTQPTPHLCLSHRLDCKDT